MKIGILGSGMVGQALASGFMKLGHEVTIGSREGKKIENWDGEVGNFAAVAKNAELVVLSVKGHAAEELVSEISEYLKGKTVIDTTNPIIEGAPENGVIKFFTDFNQSLMEKLIKAAPDANFVKAFNSTGSATMVNPDFKGVIPSMFICGDSDEAKETVSGILKDFGWEAQDFGKATSARAIEPLCILWCIPGMLSNDWYHAFKLLKKDS